MYRMFFLGRNFVSGFLCTGTLKTFKNLKTFSKKPRGVFQPCIQNCVPSCPGRSQGTITSYKQWHVWTTDVQSVMNEAMWCDVQRRQAPTSISADIGRPSTLLTRLTFTSVR